jgi:hypothetical protein
MDVIFLLILILHVLICFPVLLSAIRTSNQLQVLCCLIPVVGPLAVLAANHKPTNPSAPRRSPGGGPISQSSQSPTAF